MGHFKGLRFATSCSHNHNGASYKRIPLLLSLMLGVLLVAGLAACGSGATGQAAHATPTATATSIPTVTPAPTLSPTPTASPTPQLSSTAILDVRPASMSIVGHLDCQQSATAYSCAAEVIARSSNQGSLHWFASTTVPGHIVFSPSGGNLAPGHQVLVSITVPLGDCTQGLFFFHGPANTHTISWAC